MPIPPGEHGAQAIVDRFEKAITPRTRVLSYSHHMELRMVPKNWMNGVDFLARITPSSLPR